jgi:hypothetical protein
MTSWRVCIMEMIRDMKILPEKILPSPSGHVKKNAEGRQADTGKGYHAVTQTGVGT